MAWSRKLGHKDFNHSEIFNVYRSFGYSVAETQASGGFVDGVVSKTETAIVEVKMEGSKISITQLEFLSAWRGNAAIICDVETARKMAQDLKSQCLTREQKTILARFCIHERYSGASDKKTYAVNRILKILEVSLCDCKEKV